jgi:hypothetical protein
MTTLKVVAALASATLSAISMAGPAQAWARTINLATYDNFYGSALDSAGNLYVLGTKQPMGSPSDICLTKYSAAGTVIWTRLFNGPQNGNDFGRGLVIDKANNIWIAGNTAGTGNTPPDALVLKYSAAGALLFSRVFNGPGNGYDTWDGLVADSVGNVIVQGTATRTASGQDIAVRKYTAAGAIAWTYYYTSTGNQSDRSQGLIVDGSNNIFVGGQAGSYPSTSGLVGKLNGTNGALIFVKTYKPVNAYATVSYGLLDTSGNPLVAFSETTNVGVSSLTFIRYSGANGAILMPAKKYTVGTGISNYLGGLVRDASNNFTFLVNWSQYVNNNYTGGARLVKFTAAGVKSLERSLTTATQLSEGGSLVNDAAGNVFCALNISTTTGQTVIPKLLKFNAAGVKQYEFLPKRGAPQTEYVNQILRNVTGDLYLCGGGEASKGSNSSDIVTFKVTGG